MIHSTHRFHGRSSLRYVYRHGRQVRGESISLRVAENSRLKTWRVAVIVSRKVSKSAVVRNRIRRRVFETVRRNSGFIKGPFDLVFSVYNEQLAGADQPVLEQMIIDQLKKANVYSAPASAPSRDIIEDKEI